MYFAATVTSALKAGWFRLIGVLRLRMKRRFR
jgi:hypothetical protein